MHCRTPLTASGTERTNKTRYDYGNKQTVKNEHSDLTKILLTDIDRLPATYPFTSMLSSTAIESPSQTVGSNA